MSGSVGATTGETMVSDGWGESCEENMLIQSSGFIYIEREYKKYSILFPASSLFASQHWVVCKV